MTFRSRVLLAVLPTGRSVTRHLSATEIAANDLKQDFLPLGALKQKGKDAPGGVQRMFRIWSTAQTKADYRACLFVMNMRYNFGADIDHRFTEGCRFRETATRLLGIAMRSKVYEEALSVIKLSNTFLKDPPDLHAVCAAMTHFAQKGDSKGVWDILKASRENWKVNLSPAPYKICIESLLHWSPSEIEGGGLTRNLRLKNALAAYEDSQRFSIVLDEDLHCLLGEACASVEDFQTVSKILRRCIVECSPRGPLSSRTLLLASWVVREGEQIAAPLGGSPLELVEKAAKQLKRARSGRSTVVIAPSFLKILEESETEEDCRLLERIREVFPLKPRCQV